MVSADPRAFRRPSSTILGPFRRVDYERLPDQPRHELLFGNLLPVPSPSPWHQTVVCFLWRHLQRIAASNGGLAVAAPLDVALADHSVVQPDVIYVSARRQGVVRERIVGAPDLLIEVLSPDTMRRDTGEKLDLYAQSDVAEYWLVDPAARRIEHLINDSGRFVAAPPLAGPYTSPRLPELHLDAAGLWSEIDSEVPSL